MSKVLVVLAVAAMALPALAVTDYFPVMQNGNMDIHPGAGYDSNGDADSGLVRIFKSHENSGWLSWVKNDGTKSVGDTSGLDLAAFVAANGGWSNVQVTLHFKTESLLPVFSAAGGTAAKPTGAWIESIRSGNQGPIKQDNLPVDTSFASDLMTIPFQGFSSPVAFRGGDPDPGIWCFWQNGDFYTTAGTATPWISPSTRAAASGNSGGTFGPNQNVVFPGGSFGTDSAWNATNGGWALTNLLGGWSNLGAGNAWYLVNDPADAKHWAKSGQIAITDGTGTPIVVNQTNFPASSTNDPRKGTTGNWYAIPVDAAFAQDLATNPENKGLIFQSDVSTLNNNNQNNVRYYTLESNHDDAPYLAVTIAQQNNPPTVAIDPTPAFVYETWPVTLTAAAADPDAGDTLTYAWTQIGGKTVALAGTATLSASYTVPALALTTDGAMTFQIVVTDSHSATATANVTVNAYMLGDVNHDNYVNVGDLQRLVAMWAQVVPGPDRAAEDLNGDGYINVGDLQALVANWGRQLN